MKTASRNTIAYAQRAYAANNIPWDDALCQLPDEQLLDAANHWAAKVWLPFSSPAFARSLRTLSGFGFYHGNAARRPEQAMHVFEEEDQVGPGEGTE